MILGRHRVTIEEAFVHRAHADSEADPERLRLYAETAAKVQADHYWLDKGDASQVSYSRIFAATTRSHDALSLGAIVCAVHTMMQAGEVRTAAIHVGVEPPIDRILQATKNKAWINMLLPSPFTGELWGGPKDEDGLLWWPKNSAPAETFWGATQAPIEVGCCPAERFALRLQQNGACVRWPYLSEWMYLFVRNHRMSSDERAEGKQNALAQPRVQVAA